MGPADIEDIIKKGEVNNFCLLRYKAVTVLLWYDNRFFAVMSELIISNTAALVLLSNPRPRHQHRRRWRGGDCIDLGWRHGVHCEPLPL